uniref:Uncharacterized protein n=1 Tax=Globisporangium ultimum (strain ATCC 200006 / CBS 805.95 / DAOM BR144) TaxID=431595 RepID=K3WN09_GLOUD
MTANKQLLAKKRIVELGAGTGAVGLALALLHDADDDSVDALVLTDLETVVLLTTRNVHATAREHPRVRVMLERGAIATQAYCWGDDVVNTPLLGFADAVVVSDCLYEPSLYGDLLKSLLALTDRSAAKGKEPVVFLAYKQRTGASIF